MVFKVADKARRVLDKYIYMMTGKAHKITVRTNPGRFQVANPVLDDAYDISVEKCEGCISGSNERSLLLGVYHLLRVCGCGFPRPGKASERIPKRTPDLINANVTVVAPHRFRGICIEGSCNLEDTVELIEWMPKVGMNSYFMQFREGYNFFQRWYEGDCNPAMTPWEFNLEVCRSIIPQIEYSVHDNGMFYHAVGHGFTCECFGVSGLGWIEMDSWPEESEYALAMRKGVRNLAYNMPLISALCYSNPAVQDILIESTVEYIAAHNEIDYLHFWLDDGNNNKCECDNCKDTLLAEFYIEILNKLDSRLSERGLDTKVVFLAYHELLWPPETKVLNNPDRFTFMFAPIQRNIGKPLGDIGDAGDMKPYKLNEQPFPQNNDEILASLKAWNIYRARVDLKEGDSFDFDYYGVKFDDPGQFSLAGVVYSDVRNLKQYGLGGIVNCQAQRTFCQAALPIYVMARALMQPNLPLDDITDEFLYSAFGEGFAVYRDIWKSLTYASEVLRGGDGDYAELERLLSVPLPDSEVSDLATSHSRKLMAFTLKIYHMLMSMQKCVASGQLDRARTHLERLQRFTAMKEAEFSIEFDRRALRSAANRIMKKAE